MKDKKSFFENEQLVISFAVCLCFLLIAIALTFYFANNVDDIKNINADGKSVIKEVEGFRRLKKDEYGIKVVKEDPEYPYLKVVLDGKTITLNEEYDSITVDEVYEYDGVYIIIYEYLNFKENDSFDRVIYAIDSKGDTIWYEKPEEGCKKDKSSKCLSTIGNHFSTEFGFEDKPYLVVGKKVWFVSEIPTQDPFWSACTMENKHDLFAALYEMSYDDENHKFNDLIISKSYSANEYIEMNNVNCDDQL